MALRLTGSYLPMSQGQQLWDQLINETIHFHQCSCKLITALLQIKRISLPEGSLVNEITFMRNQASCHSTSAVGIKKHRPPAYRFPNK